MLLRILLVAVMVLCATVAADSASLNDDKKNRVHHEGHKLSEMEHDDEANYDYDHEAFLGADRAHEFDNLDPAESKERLGVIVDNIDTDSDGFVTPEEMKFWIRLSQDRYTSADVEKQWAVLAKEGDKRDKIGWDVYAKSTYGLDQVDSEDDDSDTTMIEREHTRWNVADQDGDGYLNKTEFRHFMHPEEVEHMRGVVIRETMDDMDKDKDGRLSLDEYVSDMHHQEEGEETEEEPDWVQKERETFRETLDADGDKYLNAEEVANWIMPSDFDNAESETNHLISESDKDGDGKLTKDEILDNVDLFVGSQVTNYGEALGPHEEL